MNIKTINIPPVSKKFYEEIQRLFPKLEGHEIKEDTTLIEIHRRAAQQEIIDYIGRVARDEQDTIPRPVSIVDKLRILVS